MSLHVPNDVKEILITTRACVYEKESENKLHDDGKKMTLDGLAKICQKKIQF